MAEDEKDLLITRLEEEIIAMRADLDAKIERTDALERGLTAIVGMAEKVFADNLAAGGDVEMPPTTLNEIRALIGRGVQ